MAKKKRVNNKKRQKDNEKTKRNIAIIIIIIIILLLITSCNSSLWGKIGDMFNSSSNHVIDPDTGDKRVSLNTNVLFDVFESTITLDEDTFKIGYTIKKIVADNLTCTTSDADIATCVVKNGYVEVTPKKEGTVTISIESEQNDWIYRSTTKLNINKGSKGISLSSKSGSLNLKKSKTKKIPYYLSGLKDDVKVIVSDESIATATAKNGVLTIRGKKAGSVTITLEISVGSKTYTATYKLNITDGQKPTTVTTKKTDTTKKTTSKTTKKPTTVSTKKTTSKTTSKTTEKITNPTSPVKPTEPTVKPTNPTNPVKPTDPSKPVLSSNNLLSKLEVNGKEVEGFKPSNKEYTVNVSYGTTSISINGVPQDSKATVTYRYNNHTYKEFKDIKISDDNVVEVIVTAEDGSKETYKVNIKRDKNTDANLADIKVTGFDLDKKFDKDTTSYEVDTKYNTSSVNISVEKSDDNATVYINGSEANSSEIKLVEGVNEVEIKVVAHDGTTVKTYTVTINKPVRTIEFNKDTPNEFKIENHPFNIGYEILEDNEKTDDYDLSQITVDKGIFKGEVKLSKDIIELIPTFEDINKEQTITLTYNGKKTYVKVKFTTDNYYMRLCEYGDCKTEYDISFKDNKGEEEIILYTNILKDYEVTKTAEGIVIKNKNNLKDEGVITIISTDPSVASIEFNKDENDTTGTSYVIRVIAHKVGTTSIKIDGEIYGEKQNQIEVKINVTDEYIVKLNANGGFFSPLSNEYEIVVSSSDELDLREYQAYKANSEVDCEYFTLLGWSKNPNSEIPEYQKDDVITNIKENMTLYAIYSKTSEIVEIPIKAALYLKDIDIFENKMLIPGIESKGNHILTFENHSGEAMTIKSINLEEDTICVGEKRCLNMGYILKNTVVDSTNDKFYFGNANGRYEILNNHANTTSTMTALNRYHTVNKIPTEIEIPKGGMAEVTLLWQWVEVDDALDTEIGKSVTEENNTYDITIWIEFEKTNEECVVNKD